MTSHGLSVSSVKTNTLVVSRRALLLINVSVVLVEQKLTIAMQVSHRVCVMGHGQIVFEGTPDELNAKPEITDEWLAV